jgi:hypothetical protein
LRDIIGEKFKGDKSAQGDVFGLVNPAHATAAWSLDNAVVRGETGKSTNGAELGYARRHDSHGGAA